jgi:hypothetical protein
MVVSSFITYIKECFIIIEVAHNAFKTVILVYMLPLNHNPVGIGVLLNEQSWEVHIITIGVMFTFTLMKVKLQKAFAIRIEPGHTVSWTPLPLN